MSKINDKFIYNFYELIEKVYVYNHMKTYLMDKQLQTEQYIYILILGLGTLLINMAILLKLFLIVIYFFVIHIIINFIKFINSLFKTKFHINWKSTIKNTYIYITQIFSRVYFYNFYKYNNWFISLFLITIYLIFILSNCLFLISVYSYIEEENKNDIFIFFHYLTFESSIIIEFSCCIIYSMRNLNYQFLIILFYIIIFNAILYITFLYQQLYINLEGYKGTKKPIIIVNIIFNVIFFILHINSIINIKIQNRTSKIIFFYTFRNFITIII
jgi:hypothetical protein